MPSDPHPDWRAQAFDASPLALLVLDSRNAIDVANLATGRFLGTSVDELTGRELATLVHRDQKAEVDAMISMARTGQRPDRREVLFLRPDGSIRIGGFSVSRLDANDDRDTGRVVVVIRDVTQERQLQDEASERARIRLDYEVAQRREAEGTAERAETGLRLLIDTIPDLAMVHERGRLVHVNEKTATALGYDNRSDLIGRLILDLVHPDDWVIAAERVRSVNEHGTITSPRVIHFQRKDGTYLDLEFVGMPIAFRGRPVALSLGRDLTERKKLEAKLALSERLVAMGRLVAGIGHEINNPLSYVMGNLELLQETIGDAGGEAHELIRDCLEGAERIRKIIAGLKSMSRGGEHRTAVDLGRVIELAIAMTHNEIRHRAQLVSKLGDTPAVMADENRLGQVFVNLLVNAAQAIPDGQATTNEVGIQTWTDAQGRACIEIRDSGCGVPAEDLPRIFDPFFTTKAVGLGTGLGLSISHNIVTEYGGTMTVASEFGRGTTFQIVLPPSPVPHTGTSPRTAPINRPVRRCRVLVIDDEPAIGVLVRRTLSSAHEVIVTHSGPEAIERIARGDTYDVILCDLMMPDMTGMDVHARLTELAPEQASRITFITGGAFTKATTEFIESTRHEVLEKPFSADTLRAAVRAMVDRVSAPSPR